jgi:dihydrofolate synthase/folylpolyglutamate synthase
MNYQQTLDYLYNSLPMFQQIGSKAYKEGLENTYALDEHFKHPHRHYKTIHVAGTNGKGSVSHTLAAVLQSAGYKVGLYTSPHLVDFRERIRVNGEVVPEKIVIDFVEKHRAFFEPLYPSFFELTTAMAFLYFAEAHVDVAVIEVGLGGRLDCTNIIMPDLSIITNISLDHTALLGDTREKIAREKAGIIKPNVPVIIGEDDEETKNVFIQRAIACNAPLFFAERLPEEYPDLRLELRGLYQKENTNTILSAIRQLIRLGYHIEE